MPDSPEAISLLDDEPKPEQPRNPDGTFASPNPPVADEPLQASSPHPQWLVSQAKQIFDYDDAELAAIPTGTLYKSVHKALNQQIETANFALRAQTLTNQPQPVPQPAPPPEDELSGVDWGKDEKGEPLSSKAYAGPLVELHRQQARKIKQLEQALQAQQQREQARDFERGSSMIDDAFEGLPEKYAKIAGAGTGVELKAANSPAFARRLAILQAAGIRFDQIPGSRTLQKKIQKAADDLFFAGIEEPKPAGDAVYEGAIGSRPTEQEWRNGSVARPTQRKPVNLPPGEEKAIKNLEKKQAELARQQGGEDAEIMDTLLG